MEYFHLGKDYDVGDVSEELADVLIYCFHMTDTLDWVIKEIIFNKMEKNALKGEDMRFEGEHIITDFNMMASTDRSMFGIKMMYDEDSEKALKLVDEIIKNTYHTLMTRGMKWGHVYCEEEQLQGYFNEFIGIICYNCC